MQYDIIRKTYRDARGSASASQHRPAGGARCQLLSTLNVHCIEGAKDAVAKPEVVRSKAIIRSGYLYKKSLKQTVAATCTFVG